ncbi:MAG: hypothetical protein J7J82_06680 [Staphylothermus sp.]|nr:hypothetical protein [Staphylothermus sp.]
MDKEMRKIVPTTIIMDNKRPHDLLEEISIIYYLFSQKNKKIKKIVPIYYPFYVLEISAYRSLVFDPFNGENLVIKYMVPDISILSPFIEDNKNLSSKLDELNSLIKNYKKKLNVHIYELRIENVLKTRKLLEELSILFSKSIPKDSVSGMVIETKEINKYEKTLQEIKKFFKTIETSEQDLAGILSRLFTNLSSYENIIKEKSNKIYDELSRTAAETQKIIKNKINTLNKKLAEDLRIVQEKYQNLIDTYMKRLRQIDEEINHLTVLSKSSKGKQQEYYKSLIKNLLQEKKKIKKLIEEAEKESNKELYRVKDRYTRMIKAEKNRLTLIEVETENILRRTDRVIEIIESKYTNIYNNINELIEIMHKYINTLGQYTITSPPLGEGIYFLQSFIVVSNKDRDIITPLNISHISISGSVSYRYYNEIRKYLLRNKIFKESLRKAEINGDLEKHNLLKNIDKKDIIETLETLREKYPLFSYLNPDILK